MREKFIIYSENGILKMTGAVNFNCYIRNANEITIFRGFNDPRAAMQYILKYCKGITEDDFIIYDEFIKEL